jgi:lysophospholipase L1-like esterase
MKRVLKLIALNLAVFLGLCVVFELVMQLRLPKGARVPGHHQVFCEYDPLLGWKLSPGKIGTRSTPEYHVTESINPHGLRGPDYAYDKPAGVYRVLLVGDSMLEGSSVTDEQVVSERLRASLQTAMPGRRVEVINAGVGGYSTDQEYLLFKNELVKYRPDLTVLFFTENDVYYNSVDWYDLAGRGSKPVFELQGDSLRLTGVPVPRPSAWNLNRVAFWLYTHTFLGSRLVFFVTHLLNVPPGASGFPQEYGVFKKTYDEPTEKAWRITSRLFRSFREESDRIGSRFVLFYVPVYLEVVPGKWQEMERIFHEPDQALDIDRLPREFTAAALREHIESINPDAAFRSEETRLKQAQNRSLYYAYDGGHWNAAGHQLAAEELSRYLLQMTPKPSAAATPSR